MARTLLLRACGQPGASGLPVNSALDDMSYYRAGQYHTFAGYEGARQRSIHVAGEHCSVDHQGSTEGAAAKAVLADLRRGRTRRR